ncbi:unnamed protein product, partial [Phaeothamnion confervicola]
MSVQADPRMRKGMEDEPPPAYTSSIPLAVAVVQQVQPQPYQQAQPYAAYPIAYPTAQQCPQVYTQPYQPPYHQPTYAPQQLDCEQQQLQQFQQLQRYPQFQHTPPPGSVIYEQPVGS